MKLENFTSIPSESLRELIRFAKPSGVADFEIAFKNCSDEGGSRGRAYTKGCAFAGRAKPYVIVAVSKRLQRPRWKRPEHRAGCRSGNGAYLPVTTFTALEEFLYLIAHELRHLWQSRVKSGRRVWGARGKFSERDACAYGIQILRRFRREHPLASKL